MNLRGVIHANEIIMKRFEEFQIDALTVAFEESDHLTKEKKVELVKQTGLDVEQVTSWFNRRRARHRDREARRRSERGNAELRQALKESAEREAELRQKLDECRRREGELRVEIMNLRQQLGAMAVVDSVSDIDPILGFVSRYK